MDAVTWMYIAIEVLSALGLIFLILMHSGKGGGLSDMFGGSVGAAAQGSTVVERNLYGIVSLSSRIVEPMIAISIVYVAIENLVTSELKPWRVAIVFAFATVTLDLRLQ